MSKTKYDWEYMSDAVDRLMPDSTERGAMLSVASGLMKAAYAAGVLAGRAEQREADAAVCDERAKSHTDTMAAETQADAGWTAPWYQMIDEAAACADAIRAANRPAPGEGGQANV